MTKKVKKQIEDLIAKYGPIKNLRQLGRIITLIEGKKSQARYGDVLEMLKIEAALFELETEDGGVFASDFGMIKVKKDLASDV